MAEQTSVVRDVAIVGGGAAGLSAALTLTRARRAVTVVDAGEPRNAPAEGVHRLLALDGVKPTELLARGRDEVLGPDRTGLVDELPDVAGVREQWGNDVLHCPYCHGWEVRDRRIGVLATEPMAVHKALLFRQWRPDVVFFAGDRWLEPQERAQLDALDVVVSTRMVARTGPFAGIGIAPTPHPAGAFIESDAFGQTAVPGVWAAGNASDISAQVSGAAAEGACAALHINADLVKEDLGQAVAALADATTNEGMRR